MKETERERRYLVYIRDSIERIERYAPRTLARFLNDQVAQDAIIWRLQTISDAARNHVSDALKARHPDIPWRAVYGFRNVAAHGYGDIHLERVWEIVSEYLHPLKGVVKAELRVGRRPPPGLQRAGQIRRHRDA